MKPEVIKLTLTDMQVCVSADWTDREVIAFAEGRGPSGTKDGWAIRKEGDVDLAGAPERNPCADDDSFVHIMLDA